jgi:tetratricopeptide (TPR) repeat protein
MSCRSLRNLAAALLLGTAAVTAAGISTITSVQAATVRPAVGKALQAAIELAKSGNGSGALAKVREAESVGGLTSSEQQAIAQTKEFIAVKTGQGNAGGAAGAKAKFAADYNAGRYRDVVADADLLRKYNAYDGQSALVVAQAYYLLGEYSTAMSMLGGMGDGENVLELYMSAAAKSGNASAEQSAAERLILRGQTKYWTFALAAAEQTGGMNDHLTLDIYRVRYLTNNMRNGGDYELLSQLALEFGCAGEAQGVVQKGFDAKILSGDRDTRLLTMAQKQSAAGSADAEKAAAASKTGDASVKLGEIYWGLGRYQDSLNAVQAGIAKGANDTNNAQLRLGMAYMGLGKKDEAVRAFGAVKGDPKAAVIAHLWSLYARSH